jgi:protein tyrosine phosphatase
MLFNDIKMFTINSNNSNLVQEIIPCVWLGSLRASNDLELMEEQQFQAVIRLRTKSNALTDPTLPSVIEYLNRPQSVREYYDSHNILETICDINDTRADNIGVFFQELVKLICKLREKGDKILVHCDAGMSRSVCVVAALMLFDLVQQHELQSNPMIVIQSVLDHIKSRRQISNPNEEFVRQLRLYYLGLIQSGT